MLMRLSCAALIVFASSAANAQQREAVFQKVGVQGAAFDVIVAAPRSGGAIFDLSESPDALLINLAGGKLALGFEQADTMLKMLESVQAQGCSFVDSKSHTPVAVYLLPKTD